MTINPIAFAEEVNQQFLRYQLTAFPLSDPEMARQAKEMLEGPDIDSHIVKGPYISLSRSFAEGEYIEVLIRNGLLHPAIQGIAEYPRMFAHQQEVLNAVKEGHHVLVSTGTGSGKTEAFLYPIIDHCLELRDNNAPPGIVAIIVYPMNALASDQLIRLRRMLAGTGISFGMYVGSTPSDENDLGSDYVKMKEGEGKDRIPYYQRQYEDHPNITIAPFEERLTEKEMAESPPRILLTNVNQLEYLMTRGKDLGMFEDAPLKYLVFDEAHTYTGSKGAEVSLLIRRIRTFCNKSSDDVICIGTSATITDPKDSDEAARRFAYRFFGVDQDNVVLVEEIYQKEEWPPSRVKPLPLKGDLVTLFNETLSAIDREGQPDIIYRIISRITTQEIDKDIPWREGLYHALKNNEMVKVIYDTLGDPLHIIDATRAVWNKMGRGEPVPGSENELLIYLALGASAEKEGSPILRPQLHYFVRGMGGAAIVFEEPVDDSSNVKLYFSSKKAGENNPDILPTGIFPVVTCTNCGQHFFEAFVGHMDSDSGFTGGLTDEENVYWPITSEEEGKKVVFTNRFFAEEDEDEDSKYSERLESKRNPAWVCRYCGSIHHRAGDSCSRDDCKRKNSLVRVHLIQEHGDVKSCPSCGHKGGKSGGKYYSPLRPLRAVTVADIHILAQDMINSQKAENRKLIIFADNRQDSAFQAAWMADHARRYRLRHLMYDLISNSDSIISVGDLRKKLNDFLKENKELSRTLAPEVYANQIEEKYSTEIEKDMKRFLRMFIVRELVTGFSLKDSLETLGLINIRYFGLDEENEYVQGLAAKYNMFTEDMVKGIETILDVHRRGRRFYDKETPIFTQYWHSGCDDVQRGFIPLFDFPPKGLKHFKDPGDKSALVVSFNSHRGITFTKDFTSRWGVEKEYVNDLIEDIWNLLVKDLKILTPVELLSSGKKPLTGATGVYQIDSSKVGLVDQYERYRCSICNRYHSIDTPGSVCTKKGCPGRLIRESAPDENYNVSLLKKDFSMLMVREHTAQVPMKERSYIENQFKKPEGSVNCIVATPTLELGVDIGDLDMVLLRNVPPLPSNYWQRSGRAGRRHRMAVIYTYCRKSVHDEYFYEEPMRILSGRIHPPRFNLRNPVMIQKHVHASVLSELVKYGQSEKISSLTDEDKLELVQVIKLCFPGFISDYLFEENRYREEPTDVSPLIDLIHRYRPNIIEKVHHVFKEHWPEEGRTEISEDLLDSYVDDMAENLEKHIKIIHDRLMWAIHTRNLINQRETKLAQLDEVERRLRFRCIKYIEELRKNHLENYTLNVLARGGFLPGYATHQGNITAVSQSGYRKGWERMTFELTRADTIAIREFVPGNLIYANGGKYKVSWYHIPVDKGTLEPERYYVNPKIQHFQEASKPLDGYADDSYMEIKGTKICDTDLAFMSHVSDDEENRFRMPVQMAGHLMGEHRGIDIYGVGGDKEFFHLHGQKIRLGNIGPSDKVSQGEIGYPFCRVCGATRSPYASDTELEHFKERHNGSCGEVPEKYAFTADSQVDALMFKGFQSMGDAVNLAEGIRTSANIHLEMDPDDLQLHLFRMGEEEYDIVIYDPMPGGSGLLDQMIEQWVSLLDSGIEALSNCSSNCEKSCYDCLRTYRNMFYHEHLDRHRAVELLQERKTEPKLISTIPPNIVGKKPEGKSTNPKEMKLAKLLEEHGFPPFDRQKVIPIEGSYQRTKPDFYYEDERKDIKIAIYLDGLSKGIHGNLETKKKDHYIRTYLRANGYDVVEIAATDLDDPALMNMYYHSISNVFK